jgi:hypothetical protein
MIGRHLQAFPRECQAKLLSLGGLLIQCAPRQHLLGGACEKFFHTLETNNVGVAKPS